MKVSKLTILFVFVVLIAASNYSKAVISGSAHDFSSDSWNSTGEICIVCHTPHNANTSVTNSPLWNHQTSTATYTVYSSATLNATVGQPSGISKLCLSCHDGTIALDNFGGRTNGTNYISGGRNLGTSMSNDHPISFTYDATLATADGGLHDPSTTNSGLGNKIAQDLLISGKMECSSCHDVHNKYNQLKLLVKSNSASALCLTCHNK